MEACDAYDPRMLEPVWITYQSCLNEVHLSIDVSEDAEISLDIA